MPPDPEWLAQISEEIVDPARPIIDTHHHLWETQSPWGRYVLEDLWADTESGHNIEKTVFIDCGASYRTEGPGRMKPVGETEFVGGFSEDEQQAMFYGNAEKVYDLAAST